MWLRGTVIVRNTKQKMGDLSKYESKGRWLSATRSKKLTGEISYLEMWFARDGDCPQHEAKVNDARILALGNVIWEGRWLSATRSKKKMTQKSFHLEMWFARDGDRPQHEAKRKWRENPFTWKVICEGWWSAATRSKKKGGKFITVYFSWQEWWKVKTIKMIKIFQ